MSFLIVNLAHSTWNIILIICIIILKVSKTNLPYAIILLINIVKQVSRYDGKFHVLTWLGHWGVQIFGHCYCGGIHGGVFVCYEHLNLWTKQNSLPFWVWMDFNLTHWRLGRKRKTDSMNRKETSCTPVSGSRSAFLAFWTWTGTSESFPGVRLHLAPLALLVHLWTQLAPPPSVLLAL